MIQKTQDFFNKLAAEIRATYFPNEKHGFTENKKYHAVTNAIELFNNGCLTYESLIKKLAKNCKDTTTKIHSIVEKYIDSFDGYVYTPADQPKAPGVTYCEIIQQNKDIIIIITYAKDCTLVLKYAYNSIGGSYYGLMIESFVDSIRGFLRIFPDFFITVSGHDYTKEFEALGITKTEPTASQKLIFG
jgi:hypothetical protein